MTDDKRKRELGGDHVTPFFVLRTPLLPFETFVSLGEDADEERTIARMRALLARPEIREALFVASPSFDRALAAWLPTSDEASDPTRDPTRDVVLTLHRYLTRMATRATPFGLFAGCSVGHMGEETGLLLGPLAAYRRHTRLDAGYLSVLAETLERDGALRDALRFVPSSGLYEAAGKIRHAEGTTKRERERSYELVALTKTSYLESTLARAAHGARPPELAAALVADEDVDLDEANAFIASLIASQILGSDLLPTVSGPEAIDTMIDVLREAGEPGREPARALEAARSAMRALDQIPLGVAPDRYRAIAKDADIAQLFQVDLYKPARAATLGGAGARAIRDAVALSIRIATPNPSEAMRRFREAFVARYGEEHDGPLAARRMVALCEALDDEMGLGFDTTRLASRSPLLEGLRFPTDAAPSTPFGRRERHIVRGLMEAVRTGDKEWVLEDADVEALAPATAPAVPDSFAFLGSLAKSPAGDVRAVVEAVGGTSGAALLVRFCHGDPEIMREVKALIHAEEALRPDAILAEIVHVPEGRLGNILSRPTLRAYEIPYLGRSAAPPERQIPITDLHLVLDGGRIVLFSKRLGREVIPLLTNAHAFMRSKFAIYRFLCELERERAPYVYGWNWEPCHGAPFLPRVRRGNVVLALAQWNLVQAELAPLAKAKREGQFRLFQELRQRRDIPRWVALSDGDRTLPFDLDSGVAVASLVALIARKGEVTLIELFPGPDELVAQGPEGLFAHQLVVPFVRRPANAPAVTASAKVAPTSRRTFGPGSDWLAVKLYAGTTSADDVLTDLVAPFVARDRRTKSIARWYFHRHADPAPHVRLTLHGDAVVKLLPRLDKAAASLVADGRLLAITVDTHERELERYGGAAGVDLAEVLFEADSDAVLALLTEPRAAEQRWQLALRGCHDLLVDLGLDLPARTDLVLRAHANLARELHADKTLEHGLGIRFREHRRALAELLTAPAFAFAARSTRVRPIAEAVRDQAACFLFLHISRFLRADPREHALVIYDFLRRLYVSEAARGPRP